MLQYESVFFKNAATLSIGFAQPGCSVRYTTDGSEPTGSSALYSKPIAVNRNTTITARAFGQGFTPSAPVQVSFWHAGLPFAVTSSTAPNERYTANGAAALADNKGGNTNHGSGTWLGYDTDSVVIDLAAMGNTNVRSIMLHCLQNQGAWIFLPERIRVYSLNKDGVQAALLASADLPAKQEEVTSAKPLQVPLAQAFGGNGLRIIIYPVKQLPEWHAGKGLHAWFFIDELKLY
jgi:hypothetical protein